jgi:5-(carboxyamino)imidazole ribonucleotide mutase
MARSQPRGVFEGPRHADSRSRQGAGSTAAGGTTAVGIIMGSDSDWPTMKPAADELRALGVGYEVRVVSAHRMPLEMTRYASEAAERGLRVLVAGAGGAAHLPGMVAAMTTLPVIGVPVPLKYLDGLDSLLSIVQMPGGVPVATVGIGNARNAGLLAARILATSDSELAGRLADHQNELRRVAMSKDESLQHEL